MKYIVNNQIVLSQPLEGPLATHIASFIDCSAGALGTEATLAMKEQALAKTAPPNGRRGRYRPGDQLIGFPNSL